MMTLAGVKPRTPQIVRRCQPADFEAMHAIMGMTRNSWFFVAASPPVTVRVFLSKTTSPQTIAVASPSRIHEYARSSSKSAPGFALRWPVGAAVAQSDRGSQLPESLALGTVVERRNCLPRRLTNA